MPEQITSRELFKSVATSLSLPTTDPRYGKKFDPTKPYKNWCDSILMGKPTFIGKVSVTSPQGISIIVNYGKNFVEYPYGYDYIDGVPFVDKLIISREDALLFNIVRGDEQGGGTIEDTSLYQAFPMDRNLADDEYIGRITPFAPYQILKKNEIVESTDVQLSRIESKIDILLAKLVR